MDEFSYSDVPITSETLFISAMPHWEWDVFGGGELIVSVWKNVSIWHRWKTQFFLGSKWKRLDE